MQKTSPSERLRIARAHAGFTSAVHAAEALNLKYATYAAHENGTRGIGRAAETYARRFRVSLDWLLRGVGEGPEPGDEVRVSRTIRVPVVSMVSASNLRDQQGVTPADIERWIEVGDLPAGGDWIALEVDGDSMNRIAPDGSIILVNRADDRLMDGRFYVFALPNGAATFKQYRREPVRLQPYSTNPEHFSIPATEDLYVIGRVRRVITDI